MIRAAWIRLDGGPAAAGLIIPAALTAAETARANGFKSPERRSQYLAGHGLLRLVAGAVLGIDPGSIELPAEGRPRLQTAAVSLWMSLSHSGSFVAAVACDEGAVGVDIERMNQERDWAGLAAGMGWNAPGAADKRGFLETWTLREAEYKAGLAQGAGFVRHASLPDFSLTIVSATDSEPEWLEPGAPGPFRDVTRPRRP
jgi:phosphopantetheinyl transferase